MKLASWVFGSILLSLGYFFVVCGHLFPETLKGVQAPLLWAGVLFYLGVLALWCWARDRFEATRRKAK